MGGSPGIAEARDGGTSASLVGDPSAVAASAVGAIGRSGAATSGTGWVGDAPGGATTRGAVRGGGEAKSTATATTMTPARNTTAAAAATTVADRAGRSVRMEEVRVIP
jgi:hypothetical protein